MPAERTLFQCEALPFFIGVQAQPEMPSWCPRTLPFELVMPESGPVYQRQNPRLSEALSMVYRKGSLLSSPPDAANLYASARLDELHGGLRRALEDVDGLRILEIGCGPGYLLRLLKAQRADVVGCEPGPSAGAALEAGIPVVSEEFSAELFEAASFDVIYSSMLLEHIAEPERFLHDQMALLKPGGLLFTAVPLCDELLESGNPNLPCHEHLSYFTEASLYALLARVGCQEVAVEPTDATLSLQAWGRKPYSGQTTTLATLLANNSAARHFGDRLHARVEKLQRRLEKRRGLTVGFCGVSIGASVLTGLLDLDGVELRLYDSDPEKLGGYLPGVPTPIVADESLAASVPDELWILPLKAGRRIKQQLIEKYNMRPETLICLSELE